MTNYAVNEETWPIRVWAPRLFWHCAESTILQNRVAFAKRVPYKYSSTDDGKETREGRLLLRSRDKSTYTLG